MFQWVGSETSHVGHFVPSGVGFHVTSIESWQAVALGNGCYGCGEIGHYVRDFRRAQCNLLEVVLRGRQCRSPRSLQGGAFGVAISTSGAHVEVGHGPSYDFVGWSEAKASCIPYLDAIS
ncbi:hypothetical protein H5410_046323, partial [Solanum commersonii]